MTDTRPPLQGDSSWGDVFPGLKPVGYSVFALRATQNVQTCQRQNSIVLCTGFQPWSFGPEEAPKFFLRPLSRNVQTPGQAQSAWIAMQRDPVPEGTV